MKKYKCLKIDDCGWLDPSELYIGILEIGKIYDGEEVNGFNQKYYRIFANEKVYVLKRTWFEEAESKP